LDWRLVEEWFRGLAGDGGKGLKMLGGYWDVGQVKYVGGMVWAQLVGMRRDYFVQAQASAEWDPMVSVSSSALDLDWRWTLIDRVC
jgi:hypothetical protein